MSVNSRHRGHSGRTIALILGAGLVLSLFSAVFWYKPADAKLLEPEEHWKYNVSWRWDPELRKTTGLIVPQIIIENETSDRIEGYIADANGTRLEVYEGEQVAMVRYLSDAGFASKWELGSKVEQGFFVIDIPEKWKSAERILIDVGTHQYTVNSGTPTTPQPMVFINSARIDYRTNSTLDVTEVASEPAEPRPVAWNTYSSNSLIDFILSRGQR